MAQEKKNLSDSSEIGRIAREQYQLVSPGQQAYEVSAHGRCGQAALPTPGTRVPMAPLPRPPRRSSPPVASQPRRRRRPPPRRLATPRPHARRRIGGPRGAHVALPRILALTPAVDSRRAQRDDDEAVAALLGRDPGGAFTVVVRRDDGRPVVIANEPFLRDGTPMPTRYWLVDPDLPIRGRAPGGRRRRHRGRGGGGRRRASPTATSATPRSATPWSPPAGQVRVRAGGSGARVGGSSASTPTWPGGWPAATTPSGRGRPDGWGWRGRRGEASRAFVIGHSRE